MTRCKTSGREHADSLSGCPTCKEDPPREKRNPRRTLAVLNAFAVGCLVAGVCAWLSVKPRTEDAATDEPPSTRPMTLGDLLTLPASEFEEWDIARVNLLCAQGLPGAEDLDIEACLSLLEEWTEIVRRETEKNQWRFLRDPAEFEHSEGYFKMLVMITVLRRDIGAKYDPDLIEKPSMTTIRDMTFFEDSRNLFLHGVLSGRKRGTCSSLPVLSVAIGRRLGYPLKLVACKGHLFVRWEYDDSRGHLNIESAGAGFGTYGDGHYLKWPFPMTDSEFEEGFLLKSLNRKEELAIFLATRGQCLLQNKRLQEAQVATAHAHALVPRHERFFSCMQVMMNREAMFKRHTVTVIEE